jgi:hypothetical protein
MTEQEAIEQLSRYKHLKARFKVLSNYSVGAGMTISRLNQDDQLQELHCRLRGLPTYMYLNGREERLETIAHAYASGYPSGIKSQLKAIPKRGADAGDDKLLRELRGKIEKVIAARGYDIRDDIDAVLERVAELQDLQEELQRVDTVLEALEEYKPDYARLLRLRYVEGEAVLNVYQQLHISESTYWRWYKRALDAFIELTDK